MPNPDPAYGELLGRISDAYTAGQVRAHQAVNSQLIETYWRIGHDIVEFEQSGQARAEYGRVLLDRLSRDLTLRHGKGFSRSNLNRFRQFYLAYPKCAKASHILSWSHYVALLKLKATIREFRMVRRNGATLSHLFTKHTFPSSASPRLRVNESSEGGTA